MERTRKILIMQFYSYICIALVFVILFENNMLEVGDMATDKNAEFICVFIMELLTIVTIPMSLRLFKFKKVSDALTSKVEDAPAKLKLWGTIRVSSLGIPLMVNTLLYYLFMNVAFGYMGIILLICMPFIYPSMSRCINETTK